MSLVLSLVLPLIQKYERKRLDAKELLFSKYGAFNAFVDSNNSEDCVLSPLNRKLLYYSDQNTVPIVVLNGDTGGLDVGASMSCSPSVTIDSTSAKITPTFTPYNFAIDTYPSAFASGPQSINYVTAQDDFNQKFDRYWKVYLETLDNLCLSTLSDNKNQSWSVNTPAYYTVVGNALQVSQAQKNDFFNKFSALLAEHDFYGQTVIVGSTSLQPLTRRLENQGENNATNEMFQFKLGDFEFAGTNRLSNDAGIEATLYGVAKGYVAIYNMNAAPFINGDKVGISSNGMSSTQLSTIEMPGLGGWTERAPDGSTSNANFQLALAEKTECSSLAAAGATPNGQGIIVRTTFQFGSNWGTIVGYNSSPSTKPTPIIKAQISAA